LEQSQSTSAKGAAQSEVKNRIIITACLGAAAALSLWPGGTLKPSLTNRFENVLARPLKLKAPGGVYDTTDHFLKPLKIPRPSDRRRKRRAILPSAVFLPIALYAGAYIFTGWDFLVHLNNSFPRLLIHVSLVAVLMMAVAAPIGRANRQDRSRNAISHLTANREAA
jgi:hypothetical protein